MIVRIRYCDSCGKEMEAAESTYQVWCELPSRSSGRKKSFQYCGECVERLSEELNSVYEAVAVVLEKKHGSQQSDE